MIIKTLDGEVITCNDRIVAEVEVSNESVVVTCSDDGKYTVIRNGVARHPNGTAENAITALAVYLQSAIYDLSKIK